MTRQHLAEAMGVFPGTITRWERDGMPVAKHAPRGRPTLFDLVDVRKWRAAVDAEKLRESLSLDQERAKLARAQTARHELDNAARRRELVPLEDIIREGQAFVMGWRAKILMLPHQLVQTGAVDQAQLPAVKAGCRELLEEISRWKVPADVENVIAKAEMETT